MSPNPAVVSFGVILQKLKEDKLLRAPSVDKNKSTGVDERKVLKSSRDNNARHEP